MSNVEVDNNKVKISTTGNISSSSRGTISLRNGFFSGINYDVNFSKDVSSSLLYIDQSTFAYSKGQLSFDVVSVSKSFIDVPRTNNIILSSTLENVEVGSVSRKANDKLNVSLTIKDASLTKLGDVLDYLNETTFTFDNILKEVTTTFDEVLSISYPALSIYPTIDNEKHVLNLDGRVFNVKDLYLTAESLELADSNIDITASGAITNFNFKDNDFTVSIKIDDDLASAYGRLSFNSDTKTLWGENYSLSSYINTRVLGDQIKDLDTFVDTIKTTKLVLDDDAKGVVLSDFGNQFGLTPGKGSYGMALGSLTEFLMLNEVIEYPEKDNYATFFNSMSLFEDKINFDGTNIDKFSDLLTDNKCFAQYGVNKLEYLNGQSRWDLFHNKYIEKMNEIIHQYQNKYNAAFASLLEGSQIDVKLVYYDDWSGNDEPHYVASIMHPKEAYTSVEEYDVEDMFDINMPASYYAEAAEQYKTDKRISKKVEEKFKKAIANYIADNRDPEDSQELNEDMAYSAIQALIYLSIANKDDAKQFNELYEGFAGEISKNYDDSILTTYFNLLTSYHNFQAEAEENLKYFLAQMKLELLMFGSFDQILTLFSFSDFDYKNLNTVVPGADDAIRNNHYLETLKEGENFTYVLRDNLKSDLVKLDYSLSYGEDGKTISEFTAYDVKTGKKYNYIDNASLVSEVDIGRIYNRYNALVELGEEDSLSFTSYLHKHGIMPDDAEGQYASLRYQSSKDKGSVIPDYQVPVLVGFEGAFNDLADGSPNMLCVASLDKDSVDFKKDSEYHYGSAGERLEGSKNNWSGLSANGKILDLGTMESSTTSLGAFASYDSTTWNEAHDENHLFKMYEQGMYCFVFYCM